MTDTITTIKPLTTSNEKRKAYQKQFYNKYMREKYQANPEEGCAKKRSQRAMNKYNVTEEDVQKYGIYLGDFYKLKELADFLKDKNKERLFDLFKELIEDE